MGKNEIKLKVGVKIYKITHLDKQVEGKNFVIHWKRGKKKSNNGCTPAATVIKASAVFDHMCELHCTLFQSIKSNKFTSKKIELLICEVSTV